MAYAQLEKDRKLYEVLGLGGGSSIDQVRRAYKQKAVQLHPDKNPNDSNAAEAFKAVNYAHQVLTNTDKKGQYDRMCNSESTRFAQKAYKASSFNDIDQARRNREQELYKKRASRDASRQGEAKRGSSMGAAQKEYWRSKDKERDRDFVSKYAREKEAGRVAELERQRHLELAKQRAEEGRKREAERASVKQRQQEDQRDKVKEAELKKRDKLDQERQRQEEARKRELERQIVRHQKQAERLREQKIIEAQEAERQAKLSERARIEEIEQKSRKTIQVEQIKARRRLGEQHGWGMAAVHDSAERDEMEEDEDTNRTLVGEKEHRVWECLWLQHVESKRRVHAEQEHGSLLTTLSLDALHLKRYWGLAYDARRSMANEHEAGVINCYNEALSKVPMFALQHCEIHSRLDVMTTFHNIQKCIYSIMKEDEAALSQKLRLKHLEAMSRRDIEESGVEFFAHCERWLKLLVSEESERKSILLAEHRELEENQNLLAISRRRKEETEELTQLRDEKAEMTETIRRLMQENCALQEQLKVTNGYLDTYKREVEREKIDMEKSMSALRDEKYVLEAEVRTSRLEKIKEEKQEKREREKDTKDDPSTPSAPRRRSTSNRPPSSPANSTTSSKRSVSRSSATKSRRRSVPTSSPGTSHAGSAAFKRQGSLPRQSSASPNARGASPLTPTRKAESWKERALKSHDMPSVRRV